MAVIKTFGKEYPYILKSERSNPAVEQTTWWYKLPSLENQYDDDNEIVFQGDMSKGKAKNVTTKYKQINETRKQAKIIRACLVRIENLKNDSGQPVDWPLDNRTGKQNDFIAVLPPAWRAELAAVFYGAASINGDEVKN